MKLVKKSKIKSLVVGLSLGLTTALVLVGLTRFFEARIWPGIYVSDQNIGFYSRQKALEKLQKYTIKKQVVELILPTRSTHVRLDQIGIQFKPDLSLDQALSLSQWSKYFKQPKKLMFSLEINQQDLVKALTKIDPQIEQIAQDPVLKIINGQIELTQADLGQTIDLDKLTLQINNYVNQANANSIAVPTKTQNLPLSQQTLDQAKAQVAKLLETKLTLIPSQGKPISLTDKQIASWILVSHQSDQLTVELGGQEFDRFIQSLAKTWGRSSIDRQVTQEGKLIQPGRDGLALDQDQLKKTIVQNAGQDKKISVRLTTTVRGQKIVARPFTPGLYDGKYIEINLSNQTLYRLEGQNKISDYLISTGKWNTPTPIGTFSINSKVPVAYSASYDLYMPNWMAFIGSKYGIHGLPYWKNGRVEGEDHLGQKVSHGCVRLSWDDAKNLYQWVEVGTPVYIH